MPSHRLRPARLRVGSGKHWFGMDDGDPQVIDPSMNVLQAVGTNRRVIGTVVQWNNHPETTLGWAPPADLSAECAVLGWQGDECHAEGRYFTSDYAGVLSRTIARRTGGEALYFVGALGHLVGPGGANVWEVDRAASAGQPVPPAARGGRPRRRRLHLHRQELPARGGDRRAGCRGRAEDRRARRVATRRRDRAPAPAFLLAAEQHRLPRAAGRRPRNRLHAARPRAAGRVQLPGHRAEDRRHVSQRRARQRGGPVRRGRSAPATTSRAR